MSVVTAEVCLLHSSEHALCALMSHWNFKTLLQTTFWIHYLNWPYMNINAAPLSKCLVFRDTLYYRMTSWQWLLNISELTQGRQTQKQWSLIKCHFSFLTSQSLSFSWLGWAFQFWCKVYKKCIIIHTQKKLWMYRILWKINTDYAACL